MNRVQAVTLIDRLAADRRDSDDVLVTDPACVAGRVIA
jgi:hypothetical protein